MIKIKVSCVLQFLDDYTETVITDPVLCLKDEYGRRPLRKDGGYYVFLENGRPVKTVAVTSPLYDGETLRITRYGGEVQKVRLRPGRNYPVPPGMACMEGRAPAGSRVGVVLTGMESSFRLLYDYVPEKEPDYVELYHPSKGDLTGMEFLIMDRDRKKKNFSVWLPAKGSRADAGWKSRSPVPGKRHAPFCTRSITHEADRTAVIFCRSGR